MTTENLHLEYIRCSTRLDYMSSIGGCLIRGGNCVPFAST